MLDEIVLQEDISPQKTRFLEACKKRIYESIGIWAEIDPKFKYDLSPGLNPFQIVIESSKNYDAEITAGTWCYIDFVETEKDAKKRVHVCRADRTEFLFDYQGQIFNVKYGEIPKASKK